jgi:hypothetical protein
MTLKHKAAMVCWMLALTWGWAGSRAVAQSEQKAPESIQHLVDRAYHGNKRKVRIPPGTYEVIPPESGSHLQFEKLSHFEIDARGVTLLLADQTRGGIEFRDCNAVTFRGATVRYEIPPFTQGRVEAISADGTSYDVRIEKGYPVNLEDRRYFPLRPTGYLFDRTTRWWKPGTYDLGAKRVERLQPDLFRFFWSKPMGPDVQPVAVGDLIAFRGSGRHNITVLNSTKVRIEEVTINNAGSFAVWESGGAGENRYKITVRRGPRPKDATADPLLSSTADAFHSSNVRKGPIVEHSSVEAKPDDGIAIHGTYALIFEASGDQLVVNKSTFEVGDPIRIYDADGRPAAEAVVRSVAPLPDYHNTMKSVRTTLSDNTRGPYFNVTLDHPVQAAFDYLAENPAATGAGYILRYNTIRNHRARGMLLKASNGLVEHNDIDGSTMGGIVLTPEFWWNEAGYSRNVIIRNNIVRHVAYAPHQLGGVVIAALNGPRPVDGYGDQNIVIKNNTFEDINGVNLLITSAKDILVKNNLFLNAQSEPGGVAGASWGENPGALIFVTQATGVRFAGNKVKGLGKFNRTLIEAASTAQIEKLQDGVVISK